MESNTERVAKRARVEPRRQVHMTMKIMLLSRVPSTRRQGSAIIIVYIVLKFRLELIKYRNANATKKFYRRLWF